MQQELLQLVKSARSYRRFVEADPIPPAAIRELVDLARFVPCGANRQPLRYRIVSDAEERRKLFAHTKWAGALKDWAGPKEGERPTGYIVVLAAKGSSPATDVGIASYAIQLAATERGYAACMLGAINRAGIHQEIGLPAELEVQLVIALGRPAETVVLETLAKGADPAYWRTPDGVHHVPKRTLEDVLV